METFTREQIIQVIDDCVTAAFSNPKHCNVTATDEALDRIRNHFKPPNKKIAGRCSCCSNPAHLFFKNINLCNECAAKP